MRTPGIFIGYAPRGAGLRCAVVYTPAGNDARGWFIGTREDGGLESAYFVLEDYYTPRATRYVAVRDDDLHSKWTVDEAMCHDLARLQAAFASEWLFHRDEPGAALHLARYAADELALGHVGIRHERLARFSRDQPNWTYYNPEFEHGILEALARHWPLEYRPAAPGC
jgi:hypothetical protein